MDKVLSWLKNRRAYHTHERQTVGVEMVPRSEHALPTAAQFSRSLFRHVSWIVPTILIAVVVSARLSGLMPVGPIWVPEPNPALDLAQEPPDVFDIAAFEVSPAQARPDEQITLSWDVRARSAVQYEFDPQLGAEPVCTPAELAADELAVTTLPATTCEVVVPGPAATTIYQLTATTGQRTLSRSTRLDVIAAPPPVLAADAQPSTIAPDSGVLLNWLAEGDGALVTLEPGDGQAMPPAGSAVRFPPGSMRFTVVAANAAGPTIANIDVHVGQEPIPDLPQISELSISGVDQASSGSSPMPERITVRWNTTGAERVTLYGPGVGDLYSGLPGLAPADQLTIEAPAHAATYHLVAFGRGGAAVQTVRFNGDGAEVRIAEQSEPAQSSGPPEVPLFDVVPPWPRIGDDVTVRWLVQNASAVDVTIDPSLPGDKSTDTAGIRHFVAVEDTTISLHAIGDGDGGASISKRIAVTVRRPSTTPIVRDFGPERPALLAQDEVSGTVAVATDQGRVWLYDDNDWSEIGSLDSKPVALALGGTLLFAIDEERRLQSMLLDGEGREFQEVAVPNCGRAEAVGVHVPTTAATQSESVSLLIACSSPNQLLALSIAGNAQVTEMWSLALGAVPAAIEGPTEGGATIGVRYQLDGVDASRIDLFELPAADADCSALGEPADQGTPIADLVRCQPAVSTLLAPGPIVDAAPDPSGSSVVVAVRGEPALYVLDARGLPPRQIPLSAEVSSLAWAASGSVSAVDAAVPRPETPAPASEALPPRRPWEVSKELVPPAAGSVAVTWATGAGGSLVNLAVWADEPEALAVLADQRLVGLVASERYLVAGVLDPGRGVAYTWNASP